MSEADKPGEVPEHKATYEAEGGGSICVSVEVLGPEGVEIGARKVIEPSELLRPEWIEAAHRAGK